MARHYHQGRYTPKNPEKYVGDASNIIYRSGWEKKYMIWADNNPAVLKWASEEIVIPYYSPVDNKMHRYFTDFAMVLEKNGTTHKYLIEIKPEAQTKPPVKGKRTTNRYIEELATYAVNQAKWQEAEKYCAKNNMNFMLLTEKHLF